MGRGNGGLRAALAAWALCSLASPPTSSASPRDCIPRSLRALAAGPCDYRAIRPSSLLSGAVGVRAGEGASVKECTEPGKEWACPRRRLPLRNLRGGGEEDEDDEEGGRRQRGNIPEDTVVVPDDCSRVVDAVRKACGELVRYQNLPSPHEPSYTEPQVDNYGDFITQDEHEWIPGTGQKVHVRAGEYSWGTYSTRRKRFRYPQVIALQGHLDLAGEEGTCLTGQWHMLAGSSGHVENIMLLTMQHLPGHGGGLCVHIDGDASWKFKQCQLRCYPGPLTTVLAVSGKGAYLEVEECLIARASNHAIGALGYGIFAWKEAVAKVVDSDFHELKVAVDCSFAATVTLENCWFKHNRFGLYLHDDASIVADRCAFIQNIKSCFCVGHTGKGRASLIVRDAELKGNDAWSDDDRPRVDIQERVTVDNVETPKPRCYFGTEFRIPGLPDRPLEVPDEEEAATLKYENEVLWDFARHAAEGMKDVNFTRLGWERPGQWHPQDSSEEPPARTIHNQTSEEECSEDREASFSGDH